MKKIIYLLSVSLIITIQLFGKTNPNAQYLWSYSNGKGDIQLFWLPNKLWPQGGWKIEKIQGKKTATLGVVSIGSDKSALAKLPVQKTKLIKTFAKKLQAGDIKKAKLSLAKFVFGANASIDIAFGKALGLRFNDSSKYKGPRVYRVSALNKNGKVIASRLTKSINPYKKTDFKAVVGKLKAAVVLGGINLFWKKPKLDKSAPVAGYRVERIDPDGSKQNLRDKTIIVSQNVFKKGLPIVTDKNAPIEQSVVYKVYTIGFFANKGRYKKVKVFVEDLSALQPPAKLTVKADKESVKLKWSKNKSPYCAGYLVERSYLGKGPFTLLTPRGLTRDKTEFVDKNAKGGTAYYYIVRAINIRGKIGAPSYARMAVSTSKSKPPTVSGLKADVGISEIKLRWKKPTVDVAGYLVYRRPKGSKKWSLLNNYVTPDEFYEDSYSSSTYGSFDYRVVTVGNDTQQSEPSKTVHVELIDSISPNPPYITNIDPSNAQVKINFKAAPPIKDIKYFLLIRSVSPDDPGLVIGDKISNDKNTVVDKFVKVGQRYWYRLVSIDRSGNRSDLSRARDAVVQNPPIPRPNAPRLAYSKKPILHVEIKIDSIPKRLVAIIQKREDKNWKYVATATKSGIINDIQINRNKNLTYRVLYRAENGVEGEPSKTKSIQAK